MTEKELSPTLAWAKLPVTRIPRVGIAVIVFRDSSCTSILLHKRLGHHSPNTWAFMGGHLEFNESWEDCALRELKEEAGEDLQVLRPWFVDAKNVIFPEENKHYVTLFMVTHRTSGEPKIMEPDKCAEIGWFDTNNLPSPLMSGCQMLKDDNFFERARQHAEWLDLMRLGL